MSDLRARLAEAHWELYVSNCRELASCSHIPATFGELGESEQAYHYRYADALLALPGIAIVDTENVDQSAQALAKAIWEGSDAWDLLSEGERVNHRRWVKAALLAAANAAESVTK